MLAWSKIGLKCLNPAQGLPVIPSIGLKSLKASRIPYMGPYLKMIKYTNPGSMRRNKYFCFMIVFSVCLTLLFGWLRVRSFVPVIQLDS